MLEKLDFLVVQDMYATTETARMADLVLPAAGCAAVERSPARVPRRRSGRHRQLSLLRPGIPARRSRSPVTCGGGNQPGRYAR